MSAAIANQNQAEALESVLIGGDLSRLTAEQRVAYYKRVCESLDLTPLTKPFDYMTLNGKMILYAKRDCAEQLRKRDTVSVKIMSRELVEGVYIVTAQGLMPSGRVDESIGAVSIEGLKGEARANAIMKAETKAKRRVTLSICGLGMLDETEVETVPGAQPVMATPAGGQHGRSTARQLPAADPAPAIDPHAAEPEPHEEAEPDPVEWFADLRALMTRKATRWEVVIRWINKKFSTDYPTDCAWADLPRDHRAAVVAAIEQMQDGGHSAPVGANGHA